MSDMRDLFQKAVASSIDQRGKPAVLGKADGTLYWVDSSGMTHRTMVWARIGEKASNQEMVVDCLRATPQIDAPVRVDYVNGRLAVVGSDDKRAIDFMGGRPPGTGAHAYLHSRLGPDPVYIEGLQYLPLLVTPTAVPDLTVTVQAGTYRDDTGALKIFDKTVSGSLSSYVPSTDYHFVIVCLDRTDGSVVLVDGDDVTPEDAVFGNAVVSAADIEAISINSDYDPLAVVLLYAGQTAIIARDINRDLRVGGAGGALGTPGGSDGKLQYNNGGVFGGFGMWDDSANQLIINGTTPAFAATVAEFHDTLASTSIAIVNESASNDANITATLYYMKNSAELQRAFGYFAVGSVTRTNGAEDGYFNISIMEGGTITQKVDIRPSLISINPGEDDTDFRISGDGVTNGVYWDAGNSRLGIGTDAPERTVHIVGQLIRIDRDGNSPGLITRRTTTGLGANSDISTVNAEALSDASTVRTFGAFGVRITDNTDGAEYALYRYRALVNGTLTDVMSIGTNVGVGTLSPTEKLHVAGNVAPTNNDTWDVGTATFRWDDIYATNGTIQTSDANNKREIEPSDLGLDFILSLEPVKYKFKTGKRNHYGLTGQQLEAALNGRDFAGLTIADDTYGIRYTELIGPMIQAIHDLNAKVKKLGGTV
jgi:hypothetical protein